MTPPAPSTPPAEGFRPVAVESPGGGRIRDNRDPDPRDVVEFPRVAGGSVTLHRLAARALAAMIAAARADGIAAPLLLPVSGYRSSAKQARLWKSALERYGSPAAARKWVAPPGGSAHQSGRAVDLYLGLSNSSKTVAALRQTAAWQWLQRHATRFGFYPYGNEPWHWEYNPPAPPRAGEQGEAPSLNAFIHPRVDVDAQRALIAMSRSTLATDRADAALLLTLIRSRLLCGIYKENQEVPAKLARLNGTYWWKVIRPGTHGRLVCDNWAARGQPHRGERECAGTLLVVRQNLSRAELITLLRSAAALQRTSSTITSLCTRIR